MGPAQGSRAPGRPGTSAPRYSQQLRQYAILAGIGAVGATGATGAVVYSGVQNLPFTENPGQLLLDVDGGGAADMIFRGDTGYGDLWVIRSSPAFSVAGWLGARQWASNLTTPQYVGPAVNTPTYSFGFFLFGGAGGPWSTGPNPGYIGFSFQLDGVGSTHYGWAQVQNTGPGAGVVIDWAYDNVANTPIQIGDVGGGGGGPGIPEPSSLALFALGAAGVAAYRRRRGEPTPPSAT